MSKFYDDIDDNEIRFISSRSMPEQKAPLSRTDRRKKLWWVVAVVALIIVAILILISILIVRNSQGDDLEITYVEEPSEVSTAPDPATEPTETNIVVGDGYVSMTDTVINRQSLVILKPRNLKATLEIGSAVFSDTANMMVFQAADIRRDNGGIVGAFVHQGELLSRGQSKAGFCAIINGKITIGVAESTPYFEQAIESDGYFFRQYPLVVGGQLVENKLQGRSLRKALAEINGEIAVVMSRERLTMHDFSQLLIYAGVQNAIYLVGSHSYGFATLENGERVEFEQKYEHINPNLSFIVWRK